jgi:Gti1/Pac2 family
MQTPAFSSSPLYPNAQPFFGIVENTVQALRLVHAAQRGVIPRVLRRLNQMEKIQMIVSGAVFVFGVEESGIRRWTDGRVFSPSRIDGNFLVSYRASALYAVY